ncbi:MAG TPA: thioredoxin domain-containing protein [Candidatus Competibacteraceae bacterium]|nr:thioredoxin domain-containing protein [Candidatus Competibacteraceae bacterium]
MPNRLIHETSLYLLQHAHNPVDWYPWGAEALEAARSSGKPILLSIGYSACHWCHVMAHECFEDAEVAAVMNELFVNIKVDREERPDLDRIYQQAYQLLNQRAGGWPLNVFLTPDDQVPFFAATYIPKQPRFGMPGFVELMRRLMAFYRDHEDSVRQQNHSLMAALLAGPGRLAVTGYSLHSGPLQEVRRQLEQLFDASHGGFGPAPKFPHPGNLERLLRQWVAHRDDGQALHMLRYTLTRMAEGGLYDQLGGGFCRYAVDERWEIPHFEKMLYDNGPLLALYASAWAATGEPLFRRVAEETAAWAMGEMQSPAGGYYSALDADSEGHEGRFYVWQPTQMQALLTADEYAVAAAHYGLDQPPNFEGRWHLRVARPLSEVAAALGLSITEAERRLAAARAKLLAQRAQRVRPGRDEKVLTAWNALMIQGMARAGRLLGRPELIASAERAVDFIHRELWRDGRLLACWSAGQGKLPAYLDDYAFLLDALLELLQARWRSADLSWALELAEVLLDHFQDERKGGFYFTADDHERLIQRPKPLYDEALPSGNGIAARALLLLGRLLARMPWLVAAERTLKWAWPTLERQPLACIALLEALEEYFQPSQCVILRGPEAELAAWRAACAREFAPRRLVLAIPTDAPDLPFALADKAPLSGTAVTAYVCTGTQCSAPVTTLEALLAQLAAG